MNYNYLKAYYPSEYGYAEFGRARTFKGILRWAGGRARQDTNRVIRAVTNADTRDAIRATAYESERIVNARNIASRAIDSFRVGNPPIPQIGGLRNIPANSRGTLNAAPSGFIGRTADVQAAQARLSAREAVNQNLKPKKNPVTEPVVNAAAKPAPHAPDDPITASAPAKKAADQGQGVKTRKEFPLKPTLIGLGGVALAGGGGYGAYRMTRVNVPAKGGRKGYSYERRVSAKRGK